MKKLLMVLLVVVLLTGCANQRNVKEDTITLGWIGALSGDAASLGINNMRGIQIATDEINLQGGINGKKVNVLFEDDQFDGKLTRNIYEKMTKLQDIDVVMSWTYSGILNLASQADKDNKLIINTVDTSDELAKAGENIFGIGVWDDGIGYTLADYLTNNLKQTKAGIVYNNEDAFPVLTTNAFVKRFAEKGGKIVFQNAYNFDTADFRSHIIKGNEVDYIILIGYDEAGLVIKQARETGIRAQFLGIDMFISKNFYENSNGGAKGSYFTYWEASESERYSGFLEKYKEKFGEESDNVLLAVTGYDAMKILAEAIENSNGSVESIKSELYKVKDYEGLAGSLTMDSDGMVRSIREEMYQLTGKGEFVKV